jgi:hypothetical protein
MIVLTLRGFATSTRVCLTDGPLETVVPTRVQAGTTDATEPAGVRSGLRCPKGCRLGPSVNQKLGFGLEVP